MKHLFKNKNVSFILCKCFYPLWSTQIYPELMLGLRRRMRKWSDDAYCYKPKVQQKSYTISWIAAGNLVWSWSNTSSFFYKPTVLLNRNKKGCTKFVSKPTYFSLIFKMRVNWTVTHYCYYLFIRDRYDTTLLEIESST